jgi:hypothetical protein
MDEISEEEIQRGFASARSKREGDLAIARIEARRESRGRWRKSVLLAVFLVLILAIVVIPGRLMFPSTRALIVPDVFVVVAPLWVAVVIAFANRIARRWVWLTRIVASLLATAWLLTWAGQPDGWVNFVVGTAGVLVTLIVDICAPDPIPE